MLGVSILVLLADKLTERNNQVYSIPSSMVKGSRLIVKRQVKVSDYQFYVAEIKKNFSIT